MKRIRFLAAVEPGVPFYRDLLPALAAAGADVELMITDTSYRGGRESLADQLREAGVTVNTVHVPGGGRRGWRRGLVYAGFSIIAALRTVFGPAVNMNVFLTQPPLFYVLGLLARLLRGQRYAVVVMDIYPDVAVLAGVVRRNGFIHRVAAFFAERALLRADQVIVIGRCARAHLEHVGVAPDRITMIPNWSNELEVFPVPRDQNELRAKLGLTTETVVQYSGNQGVSHTFEEIIEVALRLRDVPGLRFVFVGDGSRHHELEEAKARLSLQNVLLVPFQPVSLLAQSLSLGDIHFVSLRPGFEGLVVPSKAYGVLAAGRPMIYLGRSQGEIARMVSETGMGQVISPGDVDGLERAVLEAHRNVEARERQGRTALEVFRARYGRAHSVGRYVDLLVGSTAKRSA